jgi:hypothetical protein
MGKNQATFSSRVLVVAACRSGDVDRLRSAPKPTSEGADSYGSKQNSSTTRGSEPGEGS